MTLIQQDQVALRIPELSLVVLIGASGSGKTSFARKHFLNTEVISSDYCRGLVSDDENDQAATKDAFDVLQFIAAKRLAAGRLTVVDATNVQAAARKSLVELARRYHVLPVAIILDVPEKECHARNASRPERDFGSHVVRQQVNQLKRSLRGLKREGFRHISHLASVAEIDASVIERQKLSNNKKHESGPFDIIGDVHGCFDELVELLSTLGYRISGGEDNPQAVPPEGRKTIFVGDLVDRGPKSPAVLKLAMAMVSSGNAYCVPGNHEQKLKRWIDGRDVQITHGLNETIFQLQQESAVFRNQVRDWIDGLVSHYVFDQGNLVVAHAGLKEDMQGRGSAKVRSFALYGETTGETDEFGLPVRYNWAADYRGTASVVYGHTPVPQAEWLNLTLCIDTGCVFGGKLTALRYPEKETVSVAARETYYEPVKPIGTFINERPADLLDITDVQGKRVISTALHHNVTIREDNAAAALEIMSRYAVDPQWLIYLPPTMSPTETCASGEYLEHPREAFGYYSKNGVQHVVCEEKHMGSRAVVITTRDDRVAKLRFGVQDGKFGIIYTRTGRPFFSDQGLESAMLEQVRSAMETSGLWDALKTDWVCLDAEILPWSAKAQELLTSQYAAVGAASQSALGAAVVALERAQQRGGVNPELLARTRERLSSVMAYRDGFAIVNN